MTLLQKLRLCLLTLFISPFYKTAKCEPTQVHLAFAGKNNAMDADKICVSWFEFTNNTNSSLKYRCDFKKNWTVVASKKTSYLGNSGFHAYAETKKLPLGKKECIFGLTNDKQNQISDLYSFRTPLGKNDSTPFTVSVFGDLGWLNSTVRPTVLPFDGIVKNWSATATKNRVETMVLEKKIDFILMLGDISYADDAFTVNPFQFEYEKVLNGFMNWIEPLASRVPFMTVPGNHESECHSFVCFYYWQKYKSLGNFSAYNARFHMPFKYSGSLSSMWYSFNYANIHFIMMNTETDFEGAAEENHGDSGSFWPAGHFGRKNEYLKWLKNDLHTATTRDWTVAAGHRPLNQLPEMFKKLLLQYKVDFYFSGHVHQYIRYNASSTLTEIVVGGAGNDETKFATEKKFQAHAYKKNRIQPIIFQTKKASFGLLSRKSNSCLQWCLIDSVTATTLDKIRICK
jgi:predicted MPP superfamily phosphohydrolase